MKTHQAVKQNTFSLQFGVRKEKEYLVENLAMLLQSGIPVVAALEAIKQSLKSKQVTAIVFQMQQDINSGSLIWEAFQKARLLPAYAVSLIRVGEESGMLAQNLTIVAQQEVKKHDLDSKIRSAMLYPLFIFVLTVVVGIGIAWFVLPNLAHVFSQLNVKLPFITRVLISIGNFLSEHGIIAIPAFCGICFFLVYIVFYAQRTKLIGQKILFSFKPTQELLRDIEISRFGFILGNLLQAGTPIMDALISLQKSSTFYIYTRFYTYLVQSIEEGTAFTLSMHVYPKGTVVIPAPIQEMLAAAEASGSLPQTLVHIGTIYERKLDDLTKNLAVLLEPILLVIVWLGVLAVAIAVILPLYTLIGNFSTGS